MTKDILAYRSYSVSEAHVWQWGKGEELLFGAGFTREFSRLTITKRCKMKLHISAEELCKPKPDK
jgi:hypothetical protein